MVLFQRRISFLLLFLGCLGACGGSGGNGGTEEPPDTTQMDADTSTGDSSSDSGIDVEEPPMEPLGPGWVTLHRLNRTEYNNTVRDLLKDNSNPADRFPDDDHGYGFDNIADVLALSPLLFEKLERAAETLVESALTLPIDASFIEHIEAEYTEATTGSGNGAFWNLWSNGSLGKSFSVENSGIYIVTVRAAAQQGGPDLALMGVSVDGVGSNFYVGAESNEPALYQIAVSLTGSDTPPSDGVHEVSVSFENDYYQPDEGIDRNLLVDWIEIKGPFDDTTIVETIEAESLESDALGVYQSAYLVLEDSDSAETNIYVPKDGSYDISFRVFGLSPDDEKPRLKVHVGEVVVGEFDIEPSQPSDAISLTERIELTEGQKTVSVSILNPEAEGFPANPRTVYLDFIRFAGPMEFTSGPPPEVREEILVCEPLEGEELDCVREIISAFGRRAWRRPLSSDDVERLADLYTAVQTGEADFELGIKTLLKAMMLSPHFLYRVELDPDINDDTPHSLNSHELASRMSYALWSSMPDEELFALADSETLGQKEILNNEVKRMLEDPKASALVDNFAGQWLHLRNLNDVVRDSTAFPDYNEALANDMRLETEMLFDHFLSGQFDFRDFLAPGYTFLNHRLADFYGIEGDFGLDLELSSTEGSERTGVLTHGSVLTVTSHTFRTSPVNRGRWIMGQFLCAEPPPPPAGVDTTLEEQDNEDLTIKEKMAAHRDKPECAGCHMLMDPLGLSLEHFDAIGKWRDSDEGKPIEAFDELPDGTMITGAQGVTEYLQQNSNTLPCVAEQFFTYLLGRGVEYDDEVRIGLMMESWEESGYTLEALLTLIVSDDAFTMRQAPPAEEEVE